MKHLWLVMVLIISFSCKPKQPVLGSNIGQNMLTNCPDNGTCSLQVYQNKTLQILNDNLGKTYPEIVDGHLVVLKFKFEKNIDSQVVEGHYIEEVFIELNPNNLEKETTHLKNEKIVFSRLCFCKGQTGYYRVRSGNLSIKKVKNDTYQIDFDFKIEEVPQLMTSINQIFSLK